MLDVYNMWRFKLFCGFDANSQSELNCLQKIELASVSGSFRGSLWKIEA